MKQLSTILIALICAATVSTTLKADTGIGVVFGEPGNVGLSLRFDDISLGAAWGLGNNGYLHVTADWWLVKDKVAKNLDWFLGPGVDVGIGDPVSLALRLPIGLQWMPAKRLEVFGQVAPGLQVIQDVDFYIGGAIGIRFIL